MPNTIQNLVFANKGPKTVTFVDPTNVDTYLNISQERLKRTAGKERVRVTRIEASLVKNYKLDVCGDGCAVNQLDSGFFRLTGASPEELKKVWESIKTNGDHLVYNTNALTGVPVSIGDDSFVVVTAVSST